MKKVFKNLFGLKKVNQKSSSAFFTKDIFESEKYMIGEYTYGKPTVLFDNDAANLNIGKFCSIAKGVTIFLGGNHRLDWVTTYPFSVINSNFPKGREINGHPSTNGDVSIGNDVWIGRNSTIMSGVSIGDGAVIATESLISKNIGPYEVWGGNPARLIKKRFDDITIERLLGLKWWDWDLIEINNNMHLLCSGCINEFIEKNSDKKN